MLKKLFLLAFTFLSLTALAQNRGMLPYAIQQGSINDQFTNLTNLSRSQDVDFKLVRKANIDIIRTNVLDSINKYKAQIASLTENSSSSVSTLKSLRDSVSTLSTELTAEQQKTDSISFLGIDFAKGTYHTIVWSAIIIFALAFVVSLASFRKAKVDTNEHKKTAEELQEELQSLRKKSIEREQQLKRQLLDEQLKGNP